MSRNVVNSKISLRALGVISLSSIGSAGSARGCAHERGLLYESDRCDVASDEK